MTMKYKVLATLVLVGAFSTIFYLTQSHAAPDASKCVANGANEKCPSQEFLDDYARWIELRNKIQKDNRRIQPTVESFKGLSQTLQGEIQSEAGPGFDFKEDTKKYVRPAPPPPPPAPATSGSVPPPAPAPKK